MVGKFYTHAVCIALLAMPFLASAQQGTLDASGCITTFDANADYFVNKTTVDNASLFSVTYNKSYKVVKNLDPFVNIQYVLYQCGAPIPAASGFPNTTVFVEIPVKNVASLSTTSLAFLEMLGVRNTLKAVDTEGLTTSPCVNKGLADGSIVALADTNVTLRASQLAGSDIIFSSIGEEVGSENRTVQTSEVSDPGPLNRAEWLEFYSTFYNLESTAQALTAQINNNYNCFKSAANAKANKPVVAWASYNAPSTYNNNTASWSLSGAAYKQQLTTDAGATLFNGTTTSTFNTTAAFATAVASVDILIDETFIATSYAAVLSNYGLTDASTLKFVQNKMVFREDGTVNANDGRDWFASAVAMDDAVLSDVIRATHPEVLPANVAFNWLRNVAKGETQKVVSAADCTTSASAPIPDLAISCKDMKLTASSAVSTRVARVLSAVAAIAAVALTF